MFDGANKPPFKRNARTGGNKSASLPNYLTKQLLKFFGFPFHTAPGEAEAECALLQREGIVDAVLSEDVDTLMFGCSLTLRNWSSEGTRGNKTPTHVTCYASEDTATGEAGLDSEGMILVALMSGGDYIPAGVPKCGIKVACEAARAGFGRDLCRLSKDDKVGFRQWRERLSYELETNESKLFRVKHKALKIPENFPDMAVLGYYTRPAVSSSDTLRRLSSEISWNGEVDVLGLRKFVGEAFDWHYLSGAQKFVRGLAPALLVRRLCASVNLSASSSTHVVEQEMDEKSTVMTMCGRRVHFDTDGKPELRLKYIPSQIVGLDLELEEKEGPIGNCSESDADQPEHVESATEATTTARARAGTKLPYDPTQLDRIWILEAYARLGVPNLVNAWEETTRNPKKVPVKNVRKKQGEAKTQARIDSFLKVSKPVSAPPQVSGFSKQIDATGQVSGSQAPTSRRDPRARNDAVAKKSRGDKDAKRAEPGTKTPRKLALPSPAASAEKNPWTISKRPSDIFGVELSRASRFPALGIYGSTPPSAANHSDCDGDATLAELLPSTPSPYSKATKSSNPYPYHSPSTLNSEAIILSSSPETCHFSPRGHESPPLSPAHQQKFKNPRKKPSSHRHPPPESSSTSPSSPPSSSSPFPPPSSPILPSSPSTNHHKKPPLARQAPAAAAAAAENLISLHSPQTKPKPLHLDPNKDPTKDPTKSKSKSKSQKSKRKTLVALRESLDGAWRTVEPWEVAAAQGGGDSRHNHYDDGKISKNGYGRRGVYMYRNVEVLDLT